MSWRRSNEYVNIRLEADQDAEKVGVLYKDCGGEVIEKNEEWTKIKSGDVTGWIKNQYLYFGKEAEELARDVGVLTAYSETETLRVRKSQVWMPVCRSLSGRSGSGGNHRGGRLGESQL